MEEYCHDFFLHDQIYNKIYIRMHLICLGLCIQSCEEAYSNITSSNMK